MGVSEGGLRGVLGGFIPPATAVSCSSSLEEDVGKAKATKEDEGPKGGDRAGETGAWGGFGGLWGSL